MPSGTEPIAAASSAVIATPASTNGTSSVSDLEKLFGFALKKSSRLTRDDVMTQEIAMAKILIYCIRMLHSHGWLPKTVIRAMAHLEAGSERSVLGVLCQAMRERRNEGRLRSLLAAEDSDQTVDGGVKIAPDGKGEECDWQVVEPGDRDSSMAEPGAV